jgi:2-iminobutanoate/2-iminopropanoate deaminase
MTDEDPARGLESGHHPIAPGSLAPPAANYEHAILSSGISRWLHTSGVVPTTADGSVPKGIDAQAKSVWVNLLAMLDEAAMLPSDVVSVTTYAVAGEPLAGVMAARDRALGGHRCASTLVTVPALAKPEWLMEIAIIAGN